MPKHRIFACGNRKEVWPADLGLYRRDRQQGARPLDRPNRVNIYQSSAGIQVWRDPMTSRIPVGDSYTSGGAQVVYLSDRPRNTASRHKYQ